MLQINSKRKILSLGKSTHCAVAHNQSAASAQRLNDTRRRHAAMPDSPTSLVLEPAINQAVPRGWTIMYGPQCRPTSSDPALRHRDAYYAT